MTTKKYCVNIRLEIQTGGEIKLFKFNKLLGKMTEKGYTQKTMAKELGISENSFTNKIKGHTNFTQLEIISICNKLGISNGQIGSYFFTT